MDNALLLLFVEEGASKRLLSLEDAYAMLVGGAWMCLLGPSGPRMPHGAPRRGQRPLNPVSPLLQLAHGIGVERFILYSHLYRVGYTPRR